MTKEMGAEWTLEKKQHYLLMVSVLTIGLISKCGKISSQPLVSSLITLNLNILMKLPILVKVTEGIRKEAVFSLGIKNACTIPTVCTACSGSCIWLQSYCRYMMNARRAK